MSDQNQTNVSDQTNVDWDSYDLGSAAKPQKPFPVKGTYLFRVPQLAAIKQKNVPGSIFRDGKEGQLLADVGPLFVVGGEYDGFEVRYVTVSNKRYSNRNASQMGDFLLAAHSPFRPQTEEQWMDAVIATSNGLLEAGVDWEAYDKVTKKTLAEGMEKFPADANGPGGRQRWIDVPDATAKDGKRRVWANIRISYFRIPRPKGTEGQASAAGAGAGSDTAALL